MANVRIVVQFKADTKERADAAVTALAERSKGVKSEPGCLQFEVFRSVLHPEEWALIERWESQAVLDERARRGAVPPPPEGVTRTIEHYEYGTH